MLESVLILNISAYSVYPEIANTIYQNQIPIAKEDNSQESETVLLSIHTSYFCSHSNMVYFGRAVWLSG